MALFKRRTKSKGAKDKPAETNPPETTANTQTNATNIDKPLPLTLPDELTSEPVSVSFTAEEHVIEPEDYTDSQTEASPRPAPSELGGLSFKHEDSFSFDSPQFAAVLAPTATSIDVTRSPKSDDDSGIDSGKTSGKISAQASSGMLTNSEAEDLIKSNEDLQSKIMAQNADIKSLQEDIVHITTQLDDAHQVMSRTRTDLSVSDTTLAQRDMDLRDAMTLVSTLTEKTRAQSAEAVANATQNEALRTKLGTAGKTLAALKGQREMLETAKRKNAIFIQQLMEIQVEITAYKRKVESKITTYRDQIFAQNTQINALKSELADTKNLVSETAETLTLLQDRTDTQISDHTRLKQRVAEQAKIIKKTQLDLADHRNMNVKLAQRLNYTLKNEALKTEALQTERANAASNITEALSALRAENLALKDQLSESNNNSADTADTPNAADEDDLARVQAIIASQTRDLGTLRAELAQTQIFIQERDARYDVVAEALRDSRAKLASQLPAPAPDIKPAPVAAPVLETVRAALPVAAETPEPPLGQSIEDMILDYKLGLKSNIG